MPSSIKTWGTNADDTLCQHKEFLQLAQDRFICMLISYISPDGLREHLLAAERSSLSIYGYGIKSFVLSMMETAVNVSQTQVPAHVV